MVERNHGLSNWRSEHLLTSKYMQMWKKAISRYLRKFRLLANKVWHLFVNSVNTKQGGPGGRGYPPPPHPGFLDPRRSIWSFHRESWEKIKVVLKSIILLLCLFSLMELYWTEIFGHILPTQRGPEATWNRSSAWQISFDTIVYRFQSRDGNMDIPPCNCQRKNDPVCSCCLVGNSFIIRDLSDVQLKERRAVICLIHIRNKAAVINSVIFLNRLESNTGLLPKLMDYKVSTYVFFICKKPSVWMIRIFFTSRDYADFACEKNDPVSSSRLSRN
jgi:hypothetical protein